MSQSRTATSEPASSSTTLCALTSLWQTTWPGRRAIVPRRHCRGWVGNDALASWRLRSHAPTCPASRAVRKGSGTGSASPTVCPGTKRTTSRPDWSCPSGSGTPGTPYARTCRIRSCTAAVQGPTGRRTVSPTRVAPPTRPPGSASGRTNSSASACTIGQSAGSHARLESCSGATQASRSWSCRGSGSGATPSLSGSRLANQTFNVQPLGSAASGPTRSPTLICTPSSSRHSRTRAPDSVSPGSTLPPGNSQPPAMAAGAERRAASSRPSLPMAAPTTTPMPFLPSGRQPCTGRGERRGVRPLPP